MKSKSNCQFIKSVTLVLSLIFISNISIAQTKKAQFDELIGTYQEYGKFNGTVFNIRSWKSNL